MKANPRKCHRNHTKAFTLSEVTMSVGVVTAVLLPVLGLLAAGTRLSNDSQDQAAASRIASAISGGLRSGDTPGSEPMLEFAPGVERPVAMGAGEKTYAAFSATGEFVEILDASRFSLGVPGNPDILYLASVSLEPVIPEAGSIQRSSPLWTLTIEVEFPAQAGKADRSISRFVSRFGAP